MPFNCLTTCLSLRIAERGEGMRRTNEINRPTASATAAVSEPTLPTFKKTSNGSPSPFTLMVI